MKKPVLVVMAAGMGSRYGGLKQIDPVGNHGQLIIDYSIYDAKRAGFDTVVFVIKHEIEQTFHEAIGDRLSKFINVKYAYQQLDDLPAGYTVPDGRVKPWGTCHAVLAARNIVDGPFAVVNADDYYGPEGFREIYQYLESHPDSDNCYEFAMVGYLLGNTVTEHGHVARGICEEDENNYLLQASRSTPTSRRWAPTRATPRTTARPGPRSARQHDSLHEPLGLHQQLPEGGRGPLPEVPGQCRHRPTRSRPSTSCPAS